MREESRPGHRSASGRRIGADNWRDSTLLVLINQREKISLGGAQIDVDDEVTRKAASDAA